MVGPLSGILLFALAAPVTYDLEDSETSLLAFTQPEGLKSAAHPHVIQAHKVTGTVTYDPAAVEATTVRLSFPAAALTNDDADQRKKAGFEPMKDSDRASVGENMRDEDQLNVKKFTTIEFESTKVRAIDGGKLELKGNLGIRGAKKEITVPVTVSVKDGVLHGEGGFTIKHTDFKFQPYRIALGIVRNADEIQLKVVLVGKAK